jgi:hypothetical protein
VDYSQKDGITCTRCGGQAKNMWGWKEGSLSVVVVLKLSPTWNWGGGGI